MHLPLNASINLQTIQMFVPFTSIEVSKFLRDIQQVNFFAVDIIKKMRYFCVCLGHCHFPSARKNGMTYLNEIRTARMHGNV